MSAMSLSCHTVVHPPAAHGPLRSRRAACGLRRGLRAPTRAEASSGTPPAPEFGAPAAIPSGAPTDSEPLGSKLEKWMQNPLTFLAMGPRAGLGALTTASEVVSKIPEIQAEVEEKVNFVLNDPRPVDEKQEIIAKDMEATLAELITTGEKVETDVLSQVSAQLPPEVLDAIPSELKTAFPGLQTAQDSDPFADDWEAAAAPYTYTSEPSSTGPDPAPPEMMQLKEAAAAVRSALEALKANSDPSNDAMLKVNLRDSRDALARRVQQANGAASITPSAQAAVDEASALLSEIDSLL